MTFNIDNFIFFYLVLAIYGLGLAIVADLRKAERRQTVGGGFRSN